MFLDALPDKLQRLKSSVIFDNMDPDTLRGAIIDGNKDGHLAILTRIHRRNIRVSSCVDIWKLHLREKLCLHKGPMKLYTKGVVNIWQ
jgi:hypothetical protein